MELFGKFATVRQNPFSQTCKLNLYVLYWFAEHLFAIGFWLVSVDMLCDINIQQVYSTQKNSSKILLSFFWEWTHSCNTSKYISKLTAFTYANITDLFEPKRTFLPLLFFSSSISSDSSLDKRLSLGLILWKRYFYVVIDINII